MGQLQDHNGKLLAVDQGDGTTRLAGSSDCCCGGDTVCDLGSGDSINVTFSGITDCPDDPNNADQLNGNTYTCTWNGSYWDYASGNIVVAVNCVFGTLMTVCADVDGGLAGCKAFSSSDAATGLPQIVNNDNVIGFCSPPTNNYGYGGSAEVDVV